MRNAKKVLKQFLLFFIVFAVSFGFISCFGDDNVNSKVIMLGDSIFGLSGEISNVLETLSGEAYREYYVSGSGMEGEVLPGILTPIPEQYEKALGDDPDIRTVIMNGGGNDVLITHQDICSGDVISQECIDFLDPVLATAEALMRKMIDDGVQHIIYLGYYHVNPDGILVNHDGLVGVLNYVALKSQDLTDRLNAEFPDRQGLYVDPRAAFEGHPEYIKNDGVHPTDEGSAVLAHLIWQDMVDNNIEQN